MKKDYFDYVDVYMQYIRGEISLFSVARIAGVRNAVMLAGGVLKQRHNIFYRTYWSRAAGDIAGDIGALDIM